MVSDLLIEDQNAKLGNSTITVKWTSPQTGVIGFSFGVTYTILEEANYARGILAGTIPRNPLEKSQYSIVETKSESGELIQSITPSSLLSITENNDCDNLPKSSNSLLKEPSFEGILKRFL